MKEENKVEKNLTGDSGYDCKYFNGKNQLARHYMLKKQEDNKEKVKDKAYYSMKIEYIWAKSNNFSLVSRNSNEEDDIY